VDFSNGNEPVPANVPRQSIRRALSSAFAAAILAGPVAAVMAQSTIAETVRFEVASVKPATDTKHGLWYTGDRVQILGLSIQELLAAAYKVKDYQVSGPGWIRSARFDVVAKLPQEAVGLADSSKSAQIWLMSQTLLTERFKLKFHRETRSLSALELVVDDRGPKFQQSGPDPGYNVNVRRGRGRLAAEQLPMRQFVEILGDVLEVPLVDKTGIKGAFDVKLLWAPDTPSGTQSSDASDLSGRADIRTALREQLGLKLVSAKLPVEVLVVDSVEKPDDN
jgi:uncharacterized protein (TIGR03435 family)